MRQSTVTRGRGMPSLFPLLLQDPYSHKLGYTCEIQRRTVHIPVETILITIVQLHGDYHEPIHIYQVHACQLPARIMLHAVPKEKIQ